MPQACSICSHADRLQIEASLVAGMPLRDIAGQFDVSRNAVHRHKQNCMRSAIAAVQEEQIEQTAWNALTDMQWLRTEARKIYKAVFTDGDYRTSLQALGEMRKQTELFSDLLSGIEQTSQAQLEQEYISLCNAIFETLEAFPDARIAVARTLLALKKAHDISA